jgi:hypothetical protein
MKILWHLVLPDKASQKRLNDNLQLLVKPFLYSAILLCSGVIFAVVISNMFQDRSEQMNADKGGVSVAFAIIVGAVLVMNHPRHATCIILSMEGIICVIICFLNYFQFYKKDLCNADYLVQLKHQTQLVDFRQFIINIYICFSIFLTPFCDRFFLTFSVSSLYYVVEMFQINEYQPPSSIDRTRVTQQIMVNAGVMFMAVYFIRATLTKFFVVQME